MKSYLIVGALLLVIIALLATNKKLVETVKNIFKIEDLRKRLIYTCLLILVYRPNAEKTHKFYAERRISSSR